MNPERRNVIVTAVVLGLIVLVAGWYVYAHSLAADLRAGDQAIAAGRPDLAEAAFRRALTRDPDNERAMYGIGWAWHMAGEQDQAREAFQLLEQVHPESPLGYKGMGSVWMAGSNGKEAKAAWAKALEKAGTGPEAIKIEYDLAMLALQGKDGEAALSGFDDLLKTDVNRPEFHWGRAESLLKLKRLDEALKEADEAVRCAGDDGSRYEAMALVTRARTLSAVSGNRVDPKDCKGTAPPTYAWLAEADKDLDLAQSLGMDVPELPEARRTVLMQRSKVDDACPGLRVLGAPVK